MGRKKNSEAIVQILILTGTALLLAGGMLSGRVNYYIHPRYHAGIWVSVGILFLFVIRLLADLKKARHNVNLKPYTLFAVPILIAILFPASGITNPGMAIAGVDSSAGSLTGNPSSNIDNMAEEEEYNEDYTNNEDYINNPDNDLTSSYDTWDDYTEAQELADPADENIPAYDNMSEKYAGKVVDGATVIEDDYFASWFYDLYDYLEDFIGKRYRYLAQVYPSDEFGENRFLAGRYIMVCCAADAAGYGILCESDKSSSLKENEWIIVTGTVQAYDYNGTKIPILTDTVITKTQAPKDEYVYYNFY